MTTTSSFRTCKTMTKGIRWPVPNLLSICCANMLLEVLPGHVTSDDLTSMSTCTGGNKFSSRLQYGRQTQNLQGVCGFGVGWGKTFGRLEGERYNAILDSQIKCKNMHNNSHTTHTHTHIYACFARSCRATAFVVKESLKSASLQKRSHGHHDSLRSLIVCAVPCSMSVCCISLYIPFFKSHIRRAQTLVSLIYSM